MTRRYIRRAPSLVPVPVLLAGGSGYGPVPPYQAGWYAEIFISQPPRTSPWRRRAQLRADNGMRRRKRETDRMGTSPLSLSSDVSLLNRIFYSSSSRILQVISSKRCPSSPSNHLPSNHRLLFVLAICLSFLSRPCGAVCRELLRITTTTWPSLAQSKEH